MSGFRGYVRAAQMSSNMSVMGSACIMTRIEGLELDYTIRVDKLEAPTERGLLIARVTVTVSGIYNTGVHCRGQ